MLQSNAAAVSAGCRLICIIAGIFLLTSDWTARRAEAGDWMYRRSYFSGTAPGGPPNSIVPGLRSRWAYRRPLVGTGYGYAVRGGYRYNRIFLRSGQSTDLTIIREDWFDTRP